MALTSHPFLNRPNPGVPCRWMPDIAGNLCHRGYNGVNHQEAICNRGRGPFTDRPFQLLDPVLKSSPQGDGVHPGVLCADLGGESEMNVQMFKGALIPCM